jgi:calcium-dependent protein kinase
LFSQAKLSGVQSKTKMGLIESTPAGVDLHDSWVALEKLAKKSGSISIFGRYTTQRPLQSDYTFKMINDKPKVIGTGMSGPVRLATGRDGRQYAVKSFKKDRLISRAKSELKSEVEIFLSMDHPHIARLEQVYETADELHLVMEYLSGGELFERLTSKKMFTEQAAADVAHQLLLAVAYLHAHSICHRDLKLENFMYERRDNDNVKLIDFGFSKICTGRRTMSKACGSIHYVAPEVLGQSYTSQADMWSIGVISHMLLTGSPVFRGTDEQIMRSVRHGQKQLSSRFGKLSATAQDFVQSLLVLDPKERLTAQGALEHPFVASRRSKDRSIDVGLLDSLRKYADASPFRRACLSMMAWSLSPEDRANLWEDFLAMDIQHKGSISLSDFQTVVLKFCRIDNVEAANAMQRRKNEEAEGLFATLDANHDQEVCYSEYLAAVLQDKVCMHDKMLRNTFARFDRDQAGMITVENLCTVLGDTFESAGMKELLAEADFNGNGSICFDEFAQFLQQPELDSPLAETEYAKVQDHEKRFFQGCSPIGSPAACGREKHSFLAASHLDKMKPGVLAGPQPKGSPTQNSLMRAAAAAAFATSTEFAG